MSFYSLMIMPPLELSNLKSVLHYIFITFIRFNEPICFRVILYSKCNEFAKISENMTNVNETSPTVNYNLKYIKHVISFFVIELILYSPQYYMKIPKLIFDIQTHLFKNIDLLITFWVLLRRKSTQTIHQLHCSIVNFTDIMIN